MTIQQMEYIVALDTYRHFVKAAEHCFVTQPTLTMQVKKLEDEIGIAIFDRKKTPLEPTALGETIVLKARSILREVHQLKELVNDEKENLTGTFKIGIIPTVAPYLIPLFAMNFANKYPLTQLIFKEMKSEDIVEALNSDQVDMGILVTPLEEQNLREVPLYNEPFTVFASQNHPLAKKSFVTKNQIAQAEGLWLLNEGNCFRNQVLNICKESANQPFTYESGSIETIKNLIQNNDGFTLVPELSLANSKFKGIPFKDPKPIREVSIVVHNGFAKEILIEKLREEILNEVPLDYVKNEHYIRVKWR
ncbi:MAG: LysR family hydrogen peroxide-inducible transcriptional activator [Parvicellaceae bacterium]|jgi:LysR family hydrogen peroxide-inducible transcriptional activator